MAYLVKLTARAQRDLVSLQEDIHAAESAAALRWYQGSKRAILTLERHPNRCPVAPEKKQVRHRLYDIYRVIYRVLERKCESMCSTSVTALDGASGGGISHSSLSSEHVGSVLTLS